MPASDIAPPGAPAARSTGHPAPHRHRVSAWQVGFGLFGGPTAWSAQSLLDAGLAGYACFPKDEPLAAPLWNGLGTTLIAINAIAIIVSVLAGLAAWAAYRKSGAERPGSAQHLLESGDGRTRFLAFAGILTSLLFIIAVVFGTFEVFMVTPCPG